MCQHDFCQFITGRAGKTAAPDVLFRYHPFQEPVLHEGGFPNISLAWLIFAADKANPLNSLSNKEIHDLLADARKVNIDRIVLAAWLVKVDKTDVVGQRHCRTSKRRGGFAYNQHPGELFQLRQGGISVAVTQFDPQFFALRLNAVANGKIVRVVDLQFLLVAVERQNMLLTGSDRLHFTGGRAFVFQLLGNLENAVFRLFFHIQRRVIV